MNNEFVINWHITEACNYACHFCFAHWQKKDKRDLVKCIEQSMAMIDRIHHAFEEMLSKDWGFDALRINFAGGEPLLYSEQLLAIAQYCQSKGIRTSLITNASFLLAKNISLADFNMVGISIDSLDTQTNLTIGRHDRKNTTLNMADFHAYLERLKIETPDLAIKINTVVNSENWQEDMSSLIEVVSPYKWKIFKMLPILTDQLSVTNDEFQAFLDRHTAHQSIIVSEDNSEMTASYLMIDPNGRFYSNQNSMVSGKYRYSSAINDVGMVTALGEIDFDLQKFKARY